jgi:hypothetical protein
MNADEQYPWLTRFATLCQLLAFVVALSAIAGVLYVFGSGSHMWDTGRFILLLECLVGGIVGFFGLMALADWIGLQIDTYNCLKLLTPKTPQPPKPDLSILPRTRQ